MSLSDVGNGNKCFAFEISTSCFITASPIEKLRLPVGSSARIIPGFINSSCNSYSLPFTAWKMLDFLIFLIKYFKRLKDIINTWYQPFQVWEYWCYPLLLFHQSVWNPEKYSRFFQFWIYSFSVSPDFSSHILLGNFNGTFFEDTYPQSHCIVGSYRSWST